MICLYAGFQSHAHLQAGLASLAGTPDAVTSFLNQAHAASRDKVNSPVPSRRTVLLNLPQQLFVACNMLGADAAAESAVPCAHAHRTILVHSSPLSAALLCLNKGIHTHGGLHH